MKRENNQIHYGLIVVFVCLRITLPHYHHYAHIYEGIELLKCLYILSNVCLRLSQFSMILYAIYGAVCGQLTHFSYNECANTCTSSYYHHQVGSMTHLSLFRARSLKNDKRCISCYIPIRTILLRDMTKRVTTGS